MNENRESVAISRVESERELMEFIRFPWDVYRGDARWVPPLIKERKRFLGPANPYFQHAEAEYYLARREGRICGRISVSVDSRYIEYHNEKMGCFGFFETFNDFEVASRLLDTARDRLREKGMDVMRGPFSFTTNHECGLLVDGFDVDPAFLTAYNPPYYAEIADRYGLRKTRDWYSYYLTDFDVDMSFLRRLAEKATGNRAVARKINLKDLQGEMERVRIVSNEARKDLWGFVPLTSAEAADIAEQMKNLVIEDLAYIGEVDGQPVGFFMFLPDYNPVLKKMNGRMGPLQVLRFLWHKNRIKKGRGFFAGVTGDYQNTGVLAAMAVKAYESGIRRGFTSADFSIVLEDNIPSRTAIETFGASIYRTYRIYELPLSI